MPEYLAPGVFVEEVSYRAKSIEGVSTTTTGFVGPARFGPVDGEPELLTSFSAFERIYGGVDQLRHWSDDTFVPDPEPMHNYLAHAVRAFFNNGGRRLYVARTFRSFETAKDAGAAADTPAGLDGAGIASAPIPAPRTEIGDALQGASDAQQAGIHALDAASAAGVRAKAVSEAARAGAIEGLEAAIATVLATLPAGTVLAADPAAAAAGGIKAEIDAVIGAMNDPAKGIAQAAATAAAADIDTAVATRDGVAAAVTAAEAVVADVATRRPVVAAAIKDGDTDGAAAAAVPLDTAAANAKTAGADAKAQASTTEAGSAAARTAKDAAHAASTTLAGATGTAKVAAADAALQAAAAATTAGEGAAAAAGDAADAAKEAATKARIASTAAKDPAVSVGEMLARFPGRAGNLTVKVHARLGRDALSMTPDGPSVASVRPHDLVVLTSPAGLFVAERLTDGMVFTDGTRVKRLVDLVPGTDKVAPVTLAIEVEPPGAFADPQIWAELTTHPARTRDGVLELFNPTPASRRRELETPLVITTPTNPSAAARAVALARGLLGPEMMAALEHAATEPPPPAAGDPKPKGPPYTTVHRLTGGNDGIRPTASEYEGEGGDDTTDTSGLKSFEDIEEISIVAAPALAYVGADADYLNQIAAATQALIIHCESMRYRVAVLDSPQQQAVSEVSNYRAPLDTTRAALYFPWVRIQDPITQDPIDVPPSGFVAGIYARNDIDRGVHKAPANEVVRGVIGLESFVNKGQQEVLNPRGINCIRFFENRGIRVWGARTLSSDPEWKYLNIRRYFAYLERSIEKSTQWAVFEPNGLALWRNVKRSVEDFLYMEWKNEHLAGAKPKEAFFVTCDETTMSQNDLDNGRMICLIGVAPLYPAEFVIFRIGQWTADRKA